MQQVRFVRMAVELDLVDDQGRIEVGEKDSRSLSIKQLLGSQFRSRCMSL